MANPGRILFAALPFLLLVLLLLAVFRHPGADRRTRTVGGLFAGPVIVAALTPSLSLGPAADPGDVAAYLAVVIGGLLLMVLLFGRKDLE